MKTLLIFVLLACPALGRAATVYASQSGGSVSCGADGTQSTTAIGSLGTLVAGNTYKVCGSLTSQWIPAGNGSSGSVITIYFENNSGMTNALFPISGALDLASKSYYVVDGGIACGPTVTTSTCIAIQNTANGTGLANSTDQTCGINIDGTSNVTIQNLAIINIYVRTSLTDENVTSQPAPSSICASSANNLTVHDVTEHDANWANAIASGTSSNHILYYNMLIYNIDHCFAIGVTTQTDTDIVFHDIVCRDTQPWDDTAGGNKYHHDGIHLYTTGAGQITAAYAWNMLFTGNWGLKNTAMVFEEGPSGGIVDLTVYNSVFSNTGATVLNNGWWNNGNLTGTNTSVTNGYNNTFINPVTTGQGYGAQILYATDMRNNVMVTSDATSGNEWDIASNTTGTIDYNAYASPTSTPFIVAGTAVSYATWNTDGHDAHGVTPIGTAPYNLNATTGAPNASYVGIGKGLNLCNALTCTGNLSALANTTTYGGTIAATARPGGTTAWDIGAYQYVAASSAVGSQLSPGTSGSGFTMHMMRK